eukprot:1160572-Pelagomonas_calceolata.AAC.2
MEFLCMTWHLLLQLSCPCRQDDGKIKRTKSSATPRNGPQRTEEIGARTIEPGGPDRKVHLVA